MWEKVKRLGKGMRGKILVLCLGCTLCALLLQTLLFQETSSALIYNQAKTDSFHSLQNMQNDIFSFIKRIESGLIDTYNEKAFIDDLDEGMEAAALREQYYRVAYTAATKQFKNTDGIVALYIYDINHSIISTYRRAVTPRHNYPVDIYQEESDNNSEIVKEYVNSDHTTMQISSYYNPYREENIVRFVLKLYKNGNTNKKIGYMVCDIDAKVLKDMMNKYSIDKSMFIWLQPTGDRAITSIGNLSKKDEGYYQDIEQQIAKGSEAVEDSLVHTKRVFFQVMQTKYNLSAYSLMPEALLVQNQKTLTKNLLLIACIMVVLACFATYYVSRNLAHPLEDFSRTAERIKEGETQLRINYVNPDNEIGRLGESFNEMLDTIEDFISKEYKAKLLLNRAEYKALQAQINPHFLYNTLDTMSSIAQIHDCMEVSALCQSLSNIFRYSLDMKHSFSTVAKEIMHLKNYIYVMNVRMHEDVEYQFEIEEAVLQDAIPKISIQPLVENAIHHGIRNVRGSKFIRIVAKESEGNLQIMVEDNGVGMDAREMNERLRKNDMDIVEQGNSIGIFNINARMKMLYGEEYGVSVESERGEGTKVYLIIPRRTMEEVNVWQQ